MKSNTGRTIIVSKKSIKGKIRTEYVFDRSSDKNVEDIARCAALAFHKAIIGISELCLVENAGSSFRFAKAIQTYYPVYHLFVCNMLLDDGYQIRFKKKPKYEVNKKELNSDLETPEQWNKGKELEQDLASLIQHIDIRRYCKSVREKPDELRPYTYVLYKEFIENNGNMKKCIPGLFEKLDYIRDRAIYRPTSVVYEDGGYAQTSYDVRKEIEELPKSNKIYEVLRSFYEKICSLDKPTRIEEEFVFYVKNSLVNCENKTAEKLGYSWDNLEKMGGNEAKELVPSFLCQMMELFDKDDSLNFYEKFWKKLMDYKKPINKQ